MRSALVTKELELEVFNFRLNIFSENTKKTYKVHIDGRDPIHVEDYDVARALWFQLGGRATTIEVIDK